jgi:hypothetical protein
MDNGIPTFYGRCRAEQVQTVIAYLLIYVEGSFDLRRLLFKRV